MKSYVFPGQGSQFTGMCYDLFQKHKVLKEMFKNAEDILGFNISKIKNWKKSKYSSYMF